VKLLWVLDAGEPLRSQDWRALRSSSSASARLRVGIPSAELALQHVEQAVLFGAPQDNLLQELRAWSPDIVVLSKILPPTSHNSLVPKYVSAAKALKESGAKIVLDVADNYLADFRANDFLALTRVADCIVANTAMMADEMSEHTGMAALVIGDPVEGERKSPKWEAKRQRYLDSILQRGAADPLRILWFGGQVRNYGYLLEWIPRLAELGARTPVDLHIVFALLPEIESELASLDRRYRPRLSIRLSEWSMEILQTELAQCDVVLLPSDVSSANRIGASPNRLIESLWAGRFVVANGLPSYWEFKDCAWIGHDLVEGLEWALGHPQDVRARIARGQALIAERYSPEVIGKRWHDALVEILEPQA
jgi:glycosyltransferase involved in cell wall biosynthesis